MRITTPRVLVAIALTLTAWIIQVAFLARIGLPGATPDLLLVVVLALAMIGGPTMGVIVGFTAGLFIDLVPPATGSVGQTAAVFAIAGFIAGHILLDPGRAEVSSIFAVAGLAGAVTLTLMLIGWILGSMEITWQAVPWLVLTQVIYAGVLALLIVPAVGLLYRGAVDEGRMA